MSTQSFKRGQAVTYRSARGTSVAGKVISASDSARGVWVSVKLDDGREIKARPGSLT